MEAGWRNRCCVLVVLLLPLWLGSCAGMHDGQGWEHQGDPGTEENSTPYTVEHRH